MTASPPKPAPLLVAFATIYLVWGSTYLAIRIGVETIPPFLMLGTRFAFAGIVLYAWLRLRGAAAPTASEWRVAAITGTMMLFLGTGMVGVAEQTIDSGLAALLISTTPLWMVLLSWLWKRGPRPHGVVFLGIAIGLAGVFLLFDPGTIPSDRGILAAVMVILASVSWAAASIHAKDGGLPSNPFLTSAMQMATGGIALLVASALTGEWMEFDGSLVSARSAWSLAYLIVFGSFIAFSAYVWLLRASSPARVSTYAFVNPAVAVLLGWVVLDEPLTLRILFSLVLLTVSVVLILRRGR